MMHEPCRSLDMCWDVFLRYASACLDSSEFWKMSVICRLWRSQVETFPSPHCFPPSYSCLKLLSECLTLKTTPHAVCSFPSLEHFLWLFSEVFHQIFFAPFRLSFTRKVTTNFVPKTVKYLLYQMQNNLVGTLAVGLAQDLCILRIPRSSFLKDSKGRKAAKKRRRAKNFRWPPTPPRRWRFTCHSPAEKELSFRSFQAKKVTA